MAINSRHGHVKYGIFLIELHIYCRKLENRKTSMEKVK